MPGGSNPSANERDDHKEHQCPYCQRQFETMDELTLHVVTRHSSQRGIPEEVARQVKKMREAQEK